jgi:hypothetical protein
MPKSSHDQPEASTTIDPRTLSAWMLASLVKDVLDRGCSAPTGDTKTEAQLLCSVLLLEAERREWPEGWWEDPSVIPEFWEAVKDMPTTFSPSGRGWSA